MDSNDYLKILLKGITEDPKNLKQYLIRTQKISERDYFVLVDEFYHKISLVTTDLKAKCKERSLKRRKELYLILNLKKRNKEDTKEIEKEIATNSPAKFPLNLMHLSNNVFRGFLNYSDIVYIDGVVAEILDKETDKLIDINEKVENTKKTLNDFFNPEVDINIIKKIQTDFKDYKGKKMAFLIYLLHKEFKIISYTINSKNESRKHFVSSLKGFDFRMSGIDKYFELNEVKLNIIQFDKDNDFTDIKEKLTKIIK